MTILEVCDFNHRLEAIFIVALEQSNPELGRKLMEDSSPATLGFVRQLQEAIKTEEVEPVSKPRFVRKPGRMFR